MLKDIEGIGMRYHMVLSSVPLSRIELNGRVKPHLIKQ